MKDKHHCPFSGCPHHQSSRSKKGKKLDKSHLCSHLRSHHENELSMLSDERLASLGIYMCRQCESYVGHDEKSLLSHIRQSHVEKRNSTNLEILSKYLFKPVQHSHDNHVCSYDT